MLNVTGSLKCSKAAAKPEVLISQLLYDIETKFQRLALFFGVQLFNKVMENKVWCYRKLEIQYGGRQNGSVYRNWDIITSGLTTATLKFWLPVTSHMVCRSFIGKLDPKVWSGCWNFISTSYRCWDRSISGLAAALLEYWLPSHPT
jgi:hypothetical protein